MYRRLLPIYSNDRYLVYAENHENDNEFSCNFVSTKSWHAKQIASLVKK